MWSAVFGYAGSVPAALVERLVVLLGIGPWLILLEAADSRRSRRGTLLRSLLVLLLVDRLLVDFRFWVPIAIMVGAVWSAAAVLRQAPPARRQRAGRGAAICLVLGVLLVWLAVHFDRSVLARYVSMAGVTIGLYRSGGAPYRTSSATPDTGKSSPDAPASTPGGPSRVLLQALAGMQIGLGVQGLDAQTLPVLLAGGIAGWIGVQFLCWRAVRQDAQAPRALKLPAWGSAFCASLLMAVLLAEVFFRYVYDASDANGALRTSQNWSRRHVRFNSWGFRDREIPPPAERERLTRIILLGDSFSFGWGIDDPKDLLGPGVERALAGRVSPPPRVFTLAIGGIDTRMETDIFVDKGRQLEPHVVILQYHINDIEPLERKRKRGLYLPRAWQPLTDASDAMEFLLWHTYLRVHAAGRSVGDLPGLAAYEDPDTFARQRLDLLKLLALIRETGARPVAVLYPYMNGPVEGPQRRALDQVIDVLRRDGVPVLDVTKLADLRERRFHANPFDPHPSPALNAIVAPALAELVLTELDKRATSRSALP